MDQPTDKLPKRLQPEQAQLTSEAELNLQAEANAAADSITGVETQMNGLEYFATLRGQNAEYRKESGE
ncbi:hypothetical protein [Effusibacillus dendaii]|uniref:Uncharacterized protein n=1 Tax=Effusibacillus dendaii TaxID=2743772 RepID=A0A7I8DBP9_9BACL|nr:hypothetical protein [Effusibacillus dendaii]BCJ87525.1 hypothetical protein skT53_25100 [Effusibacillus dendaii]